MLAIIYYDSYNNQKCTVTDKSCVEEWMDEVITSGLDVRKIQYAFDTQDDILSQKDQNQFVFEKYYSDFDFPADALYQKFKTKSGEIFQFEGFFPRNTKYKCRIRNTKTNRISKATLNYVRFHLQASPVS